MIGNLTFPIESGAFVKEIGNCDTLDEVNRKFMNFIQTVAEVVHESRTRRKSNVPERVVSIVKANYMDRSLCQEAIAGTLNLSRDYLGKQFREVYGKSISDYITEVRLLKAVELIDRGVTDTALILDRIGWENRNYFYRMFKNRFGIGLNDFKNKA